MPLFDVTDNDRRVYNEELQDFLPPTLYDMHCHLWLERFWTTPENTDLRAVSWPYLVARDNSAEDLDATYALLFPGKKVVPLLFANPEPLDNIGTHNAYVAREAAARHFPALYYSHPSQSADVVEAAVLEGGFLGLKSYLNLAPAWLPEAEIRITDFFPPHQLELLHRRRWLMMLHLPRPGRLADPVNLAQLQYIGERYPGIRLIVAHVGRAYGLPDVGGAFEALRRFPNLLFDFSANCNPDVLTALLRAVGAKRVLFGSDLPITRMRMRRMYADGRYLNLVPKGLYGDVSGDAHMREAAGGEAAKLTFFLYEEILAMKTALAACGLGAEAAHAIFYGNARHLIDAVRRESYG